MDLLPQMVRRRSLRSGVQKTELLTEEDETESEFQMVDVLSPITRKGRLKNKNKKTNHQEELVDRNLKLLDGISDLDGVSEEERNQIVQALLNSRKELSFYHDQQEEKKNEGTSFLLESSTDDVPTEKQFVNNSKDIFWSEDDTQAPDSFPSTDKEEQLWHKMSHKEEAMNCEEMEEEEEDGYNCSTQVDITPKLSEKSIPEQVKVTDDEATQPLESMEGEKPEIESISSPGSEEKGCAVRSWTLDSIESEADKVEPLHRHYRIINGKVKRNPEFPLKMPDKLEYAKAILQMFEIYNRKLREAQTKCGNPLDWGETVKVGQHHTKTIDVKRRGQAIMTMSDSEESAENFGMDTNQTHSIEETQGFKTSDRKAPASTRKNMSKFRINSPDIFEENTFDLVGDGFLITKTGESQLLRMETQKLTDIVELKQKQLDPDIHEDDPNIVAKKSDVDIFEAQKINNNGRRKREIGDTEDLDDFEAKIRVTRRQIYARPAVKEIHNFEIRQSEKMAWKKGMPKTGFGKSKAMEACNELFTNDDKKDTKMCIDHENLQVENLENKNSVKATIKKDFFEEMDNLSACEVIRKKGTLFPDESRNSQNDPMKFNYGNNKESGLLVEDTQDLDALEPYVENGTQDEEGIDTTVVQESQPLNEDEMTPNLQDKTKSKHQTLKRIKQTGTELMCKMKKIFTAVQEKEEVHQGKQEGSQSPVYKKRKLLSQNTRMMEAVSVEKPGVQLLTNRPASRESNSTDPCSQGSSTMLNPVGELYSTQISIIKEKKARNLLTLNQKNVFAKSCTVFELSDSEEEDVVKQIGQGKFPQRERSQRGVAMPIKSKERGHGQGKISHFQRNKVRQEFIDYVEDGTVTNAKNTGLDSMVTFTSNPSSETLKSNKKEKGVKDKIKGEQHCNRNQGQLQEKKTRINTGVEIFTDEESMDGRPDLSQTNCLPQTSWSQYSEEHSGNLKPGKSKLNLMDCSEKKVLGENFKESDAVSNIKVSREPSHASASMSVESVGTEEKLEVDQRDTNGFESKVNVKTLQVGTLTSVEKVLSVECRTGQNKDLIQAGTSTNGQGRRGYINRKVVVSGRKTPSDFLEKSTEGCKKQVNKELITCPICGKEFLASQIEAHAATCMDGNQDEGQQQNKRSEARARAHTPELEKEAPSLMEMCYICDGHFFKGQRYQDHLEGCLEQAKRHQQEVEMKGFKTIYQSIVEKDATSRTTRSRARGHVGAGNKGLLDGLAEAWHKHEGYNNTAGRRDMKSVTDDTCSSEDDSDQKGSSHLTPPDWIKDLSSSPIRTFIPISQQQESEYFRNQFAYRLDRVEKAMTKRKRKLCRKKRTSRKRQRRGKTLNKCI